MDVAVTEPKLLGASDFIGGTEAGEEDRGAVASSIDPKASEEPCFGAPTGLRAPATPSLKDTPCPRVLGRRECVGVEDEALGSAGDWDLGEGAEDVFGGPFDQADRVESGGGVFDAVAAEDLLIELQRCLVDLRDN